MQKRFSSLWQLPTLELAPRLLGARLYSRQDGITCAGIICEVEAYLHTDEASHAFRGKTARNVAMFGRAGSAYVYTIYGMHRCFNIVSAAEGVAEAVLIRALEPTHGLDAMHARRAVSDVRLLCSGPARLCQALAIDLHHNGTDLLSDSEIALDFPRQRKNLRPIAYSSRIGISKAVDRPWRFFFADSEHVSGKKALNLIARAHPAYI